MKFFIPLFFLLYTTSSFAQQYPDRHSTDIADSWTSCQPTENPNKVREEGHWIMYDFGNEYTLHGTTLWNVNAYQNTDKGTQELVIDYSIDGENWTELSYHTMEEAPASSFYQGEEGPNFNGANARYVIITALSNFGHATCSGLSEVRFEATIATTNTSVEEELLADNNIDVSPNPFRDQTIITLTDLQSGTYSYNVLDVSGKIIRNGTVIVANDKVVLPLELNGNASGNYIFRLQYGVLTLSKQLQLIR